MGINSKYIGMEFATEKWSMLKMKNGKQPNQVKSKKKTYKYLELLEAGSINK